MNLITGVQQKQVMMSYYFRCYSWTKDCLRSFAVVSS